MPLLFLRLKAIAGSICYRNIGSYGRPASNISKLVLYSLERSSNYFVLLAYSSYLHYATVFLFYSILKHGHYAHIYKVHIVFYI
jgi:hypothetical protein